jgi:hypothetical protein
MVKAQDPVEFLGIAMRDVASPPKCANQGEDVGVHIGVLLGQCIQ